MPTPDKPSLDYSYTAFQQAQGNNSFPGTQLDNDLANIVASLDETIDFVSGVIRDDGKLDNGVVTKSSLDETLLLGIEAPRQWLTATDYAVDDTVFTGNSLYICVKAHTSDVFATDLANGDWQAYATFEPLSSISDGSVTEPKFATGAVSTRALAPNSVTSAKVPDGELGLAKLSAALQALLVPIGTEVDFSGVFPPAGWVLKNGQALSRVTYAALFGVLCPAIIGNVANGNNTITGLTVDLRGLGVEGAAIEGVGVPSGTTVASVTQTTIVLSVNATVSTAGAQVRLFPNGNGDGSTTFSVPDDRGRASFGRDNMGGTAASRITNSGAGNPGLDASRLSLAGGSDRIALSDPAQLPSHTHTASSGVSDPGHAHGYADYGFQVGGVGNAYNIGGTPAVGDNGRTTANSTTGITVSTTVNPTGSGAAHPNMPPARIANKIIFTGVV